MSDKVYNVPAEWASRALINNEKYLALYKRSVEDPGGFWGEMGKRIDWIKPYSKVKNTSYAPENVSIKWYEDGTLNVSANCIDRHLKKRGDQVAIIWEGDDPPSMSASPTSSCTSGCASSPTCSRPTTSRRATASPSTCR